MSSNKLRFLSFALGFLLSVLVAVGPARAGSSLSLMGVDSGAGTPAYTGPGDIVSGALGWWGLRGYNAAYSGNVATICDSATGLVCANITWNGSALVLPTIGGGVCNNTTNICVISTLFDQSGNGNNMVQATNSSRPILLLNCIGTFPCISFSNSAFKLLSSASTSSAAPWSMSGVGYQGSGGQGDFLISRSALSGMFFCGSSGGVCGASNQITFYGGNIVNETMSNTTTHAVQLVGNGASSSSNIDGTTNTFDIGSGTLSANGYSMLGGQLNATLSITRVSEVGAWPLGFTSGNQSSMNSNQHTYWGF